jgi:transposase
MLDVHALKAEDLRGLDPSTIAAVAAKMLTHIGEQARHIDAQAREIERKDAELHFKSTKLEKITFELARLKAWKFGAKTEAMSAEQRRLFEETLAEDEAELQAQLRALQGDTAPPSGHGKRKPRRQALPEHLRRVEHRHEPEDTTCACGRPMVRVGEDISERLDIVPAEFFVHRHVYGKWVCKCCQVLVQEPVQPQIIDKGLPTAGLVAHTLVSRFVDHIPYYRQEQINARSGVHTPRSTLAAWSGAGGAGLMPLFEVQRDWVLGSAVLHADETPVRMLDPGAGKTKKAYVWAYARGAFDATPGVVYDFCLGRGSQYPVDFLAKWTGTLVCDDYKGYEPVIKGEARIEAGCLAHSRRKFDELFKANHSPVAAEAMRRIALLYHVERDARGMTPQDRLALRQQCSKPLWDDLHAWLELERARVPDGSGIAGAIDYSLNRWSALGQFLLDGDVSVDNNSLENLMRPWAMGRKAWLFAGSELAGQRAAVVMSLVHSARLNGHDPWVYLKDVLQRLPSHLNSRIDELLPHRWTPNDLDHAAP